MSGLTRWVYLLVVRLSLCRIASLTYLSLIPDLIIWVQAVCLSAWEWMGIPVLLQIPPSLLLASASVMGKSLPDLRPPGTP